MKKINSVGTILKYQGKLCEVISYATSKVIFIREIGARPCEKCGEIKEYAEIEASLNFQERAEPVDTIII